MDGFIGLGGWDSIVNFVLLAVRTIQYVSYPHSSSFWIFYAYLAFAFVSIGMISKQWKRATNTRRQKIGSILSSLTALLLTILIIAWELYK